MQFHLNGFNSGDPAISEARKRPVPELDEGSRSKELDVLIVGAGPTGLTLASQLAAFPEIRTRIIEQKPGPLLVGQADGIACRTMEMFEAFGFSERVLKEAYWVNETSFWKPSNDSPDKIARSGRIQDTEDGLSEFPHVILNQARVHDFFLDVMHHSPSRLEPDYSRTVVELNPNSSSSSDAARHPVTVVIEHTDTGHESETEIVRACYVVGCDGARSVVRKSLGHALHGDAANQAWGVMDVLAVTNFPDIRLKAIVHSSNEGNLLIIPREGGYMVRLYIELDKLSENERVSGRNITVDRLISAAQRILRPYSFEVAEVAWWSVYEIGQRLCERFDNVANDEVGTRVPHVFIAGDACHTHSPKAGQGMNVSMQDAFNLGWKLASVILGRTTPEILGTYSAERQGVAKELIDFDKEFAKMFSARPQTSSHGEGESVDPAEFQKYFERHGRFTAGTATRYRASIICADSAYQHLARGFTIGTRFHSDRVIRLADARPTQIGHIVKADGRWRIFAFDCIGDAPSSQLRSLCDFLEHDPKSPVRRYSPTGADIDSVIDLRAVLQLDHRAIEIGAMTALLHPRKGRYGLRDYEKVFCPDFSGDSDIFDARGIDRKQGCLVVVRPDQYVAAVLPLDAFEELAAFFDGFMLPANRWSVPVEGSFDEATSGLLSGG